MVFYRKYRPQKIEELDSEEVRNRLTSILLKKSVHALLFTGPKGLGKTSAARIVAKVANCEKINKEPKSQRTKESKIEPCNKCSQCISIANGTNIDVLEIDGASNRGIDEIRDLREKVKLSPAGALKKVYIIDEAHMLTTEAFNALLKTLEEPPSHVIFVLCTTEPQRVPATIVSRCFHVAFKKATIEELIRSLIRIVKQEKISIDREALSAIANLSDGSFRDAAKILEEIWATVGRKKITKEMVEKKYQISNVKSQISNMLKYLSKKDTKLALELISELVKQGIDLKYFLEQLILNLHDLLLKEIGVLKDIEIESSVSLTVYEIKELSNLLTTASSKLKYAVLPQLPLEMAIIEWCINHQNFSVLPKAEGNLRESAESTHRELFKSPVNQNGKLWEKLIEEIKPYNHSVAGVLRGCNLKSYNGKKLIIEAKFKFHKERLEEPKIKKLIEDMLQKMRGNKVNISVILKENSKH